MPPGGCLGVCAICAAPPLRRLCRLLRNQFAARGAIPVGQAGYAMRHGRALARARDILALCNIPRALATFRSLRRCPYRRRAGPSARCVWSYRMRQMLISAKYCNFYPHLPFFGDPVRPRQPLPATSLAGTPPPLALPAPLEIAHVGGGGGWVRAGRLRAGEQGRAGGCVEGGGRGRRRRALVSRFQSFNSSAETSTGFTAGGREWPVGRKARHL